MDKNEPDKAGQGEKGRQEPGCTQVIVQPGGPGEETAGVAWLRAPSDG